MCHVADVNFGLSRGCRVSRVGRVEVLLVCSTGGHLLQLLGLRASWDGYSCAWVTHRNSDACSLLEGEDVVYAHSPTTRNLKNFVRNLFLACAVVARRRPRILITTGAGVAVPFAWIARLAGTKVVYVESITRIAGLSMSGRMIAPVSHRFFVQWPELRALHRRAEYHGNLLGAE